jgi:general secretion pathway protein F
MGAYQYSALKHSGNTSKGVIEADSPSHARQLLRQQGLIPTHVQASSKKRGAHHANRKGQFKAKDLALFTRQLATLLSAAIPLDEALRGVIDQSQKSHVQQLVIGVRSKVLEGYGLAQALGEYPHAFPELYRATVAAGEQTGSLDDVLNKLADYTEHQQETQQKIQQALIYPTLMLVVSITIIGFLLAFVVPKIIAVFDGSGHGLELNLADEEVAVHVRANRLQ